MGYCTDKEVRDMLKDDLVSALLGDDYLEDKEEREKAILPYITAAITDADAEIDGYLAKRYSVPLSPVPAVIQKFAKDMAVYNLVSRQGVDESDREKTYLNRYNAAIKFLMAVAEGKIEIGTGSPKEAALTGFQVKSAPRVFSRDSLKGW